MANKHVIFLVHGMGNYTNGWSDPAQNIIKDKYKKFPQISWLKFNRFYEFVEIIYDDEFEALRKQWERMSEGLGTALQSQGINAGLVKKLNKLAGVTNKDKFINTHIVDVLLYRFARQTASAVRDSIRVQILDKLKSLNSSEPISWSIIAHSLGTAVIHDALHGLYTDALDISGQQLGNVTRPHMLMMVANVSRILQSDVKVYQSVVRPGAPENAHAVRHYINARHEWDPFPMPKAFRPKPDWPTLSIRERGFYKEIVTNAIEDKNIHSLEHYLKNPLVHTALFNALSDRSAIDDASIKSAHSNYVAKTPLGKFEETVQQLKEFQLGEEEDLAKVIKVWAEFKDKVGA
ncbi:MAG: hypothetical protein QNL62_26005 [Gammaproteobacteria bacterium]|nr:hypothetical protein [Gammaproteobacteria bacterium]